MDLTWTRKPIKFDELAEKADQWDWGIELSGDYSKASMVDFLKWNGVIPSDIDWKRRNSLPRTALDRDHIPAGYLAEVAYEWDQDGFSTAREFMESLEFEIAGTARNHLVSEVMEELGRE